MNDANKNTIVVTGVFLFFVITSAFLMADYFNIAIELILIMLPVVIGLSFLGIPVIIEKTNMDEKLKPVIDKIKPMFEGKDSKTKEAVDDF